MSERFSHPWQAPDAVLAKHGLRLHYTEEDDNVIVSVFDQGGHDVGEVNLEYDDERDLYQIRYSQLHGLPKGIGLGTSVYRAMRDYVGKTYGKTVASDFQRSADSNRVWQGMAKSGLAQKKVMDVPGAKSYDDYPGRNLDYYVMDDLARTYVEAGCKTIDDMLEMAASFGSVALAEALAIVHEQRENSTAMVVLPGVTPGKNVCSFVRQLAAERSKLIVVAQQKDLAPGNFERLMRASMPDCEKKLRIMDAGDSLADAINAAERNRHYRPQQALQIFCDDQTAQTFSQEIRSGVLKFDPTVISVSPTSIPSDDPGDIKSAVSSGDESAMHRVLDPHVFSDQGSLADYKQAIGESLQREFLTDIAASDDEGVEVIRDIVRKNVSLLLSRGVDVKGAKFLGNGSNGAAWKLRSGKVLKITTDDAEANVAVHLKGKKFKHVFQVHDVWAFPGQYNGHHVYGLMTEAGLEEPDKYEQQRFDWVVKILDRYAEQADVNLEDDFRKSLQTMMASDLSTEIKRAVLQHVKDFDLAGMMADMKRLGVQADLHSGNFMRRPDGTFVIIDIGTGGSQESARPPFLEGDELWDINVPTLDGGELNEFGTGAPGSGANGPASMKASNSSSWSSGKLALKDPRNNVPEDENADEDDASLDWGPGRTSGASF